MDLEIRSMCQSIWIHRILEEQGRQRGYVEACILRDKIASSRGDRYALLLFDSRSQVLD